MKNRTVEILAPAGSYESMVAAVNAGAVGTSAEAQAQAEEVKRALMRITWMRRRW